MFVIFAGEDLMLVFMMEDLLGGLVLGQEAVISGVSVCSVEVRAVVPVILAHQVSSLVSQAFNLLVIVLFLYMSSN